MALTTLPGDRDDLAVDARHRRVRDCRVVYARSAALMSALPDQSSDLLGRVERLNIKFIDLQFTDVVGVVKNVTVPVSELSMALDHGIWFDGSSIEGFGRIAESDMYLVPDRSTFAVLPWLSGDEMTARLICNVYTPNGQPFLGDPRGVLARMLDEAAQMGFTDQTGPAPEFFLLNPPPTATLY